MIVCVVLSTLSSLLVLLYSFLSPFRYCDGRGVRDRWRRLDDVQRWQVDVGLLDSALVLAMLPLFVNYALDAAHEESIWALALGGPASTFGITAATVLRSVVLAALATHRYLQHFRRHYRKTITILAAITVAGAATTSAVSCSHADTTCATLSSIKITIITTEAVAALVATAALIATARILAKPSHRKLRSGAQQSMSTVASRAPSLSLLIHTQPDPWTRHIDLNPVTTTDFGPKHHTTLQLESSEEGGKFDYGKAMVRGLLGETVGSGRTTEAAATSLGYGSAVASSANPYQVGSTVSLASRDALGGRATPHLDSSAANESRYRSTSRQNEFGRSSPSMRTPSPGLADSERYHHSGLSRSATEEQLIRTDSGSELVVDGRSKAVMVRLVSSVASLWSPVALVATALLMSASKAQAWILLGSFCVPASIFVLQELALSCCLHDSYKPPPSHHGRELPPSQNSLQDADHSLRRTSTSSIVVVPDVPALRNRRPHLRSFSCPLESELNGYTHSLLGSDTKGPVSGKQRQSLSSAKSVPYLGKHWTAGKFRGDRVVAPRSSFIRGLNLMLHPHPRLEVLPVQNEVQVYARKTGTGTREESVRESHLSSAIAEGLLYAPQQDGMTVDSERTCITQDHSQAAWSRSTLHLLPDGSNALQSAAGQEHASLDEGEEGLSVILNMDDTPGSPRLRPDAQVSEHADLQSPSKRRVRTQTPSRAGGREEMTSFTRDESEVLGGSASRLFSEIMDMVRGNSGRMSDQPSQLSFGRNKRTPPKGYASIDGASAQHEASVYNEATVIIHSSDSSGDFRTAASHDTLDATLEEVHLTDQAPAVESGLARKGSTSSTLSLSSISSRLRSIGRASGGTPFASPSAQVKKVRSRTFASAFGIELGLLNRTSSRSKRDTPGSHVESSPSTSAGTCPSSLMDLSFSPSPAAQATAGAAYNQVSGTPSPGGDIGGVKKHRRNQSRADSIMDMLDEVHGDTIEEMLEPDQDVCSTSHPFSQDGEASFLGVAGFNGQTGSTFPEADFGGEQAEFDDLCEVDLADATVSDVWEGCFPPTDAGAQGLAGGHDAGEEDAEEMDEYDLMGFDMRRMVAKAPFLDTVEEEPEGELEEESGLPILCTSDERAWDRSNEAQRASMADLDLDAVVSSGSENGNNGRGSRESLLLEHEAKQRQIGQLLAEHEALFPHKTLSQIEEVTEVATTLRESGYRASSGASGGKAASERMSSTTDSIHLGLPRSLGLQDSSVAEEINGSDAVGVNHELNAEGDQHNSPPQQGESVAQLPFVTPRSRTRCRAAAGRRATKTHSPSETRQALSRGGSPAVDPSPRSRSVRLGQLGMDHGIWLQSPVKLELDASTPPSAKADDAEDGSFQMVDDAGEDEDKSRATRFRRSLTMTSRKLVRLDHYDSPKREMRNRLARMSTAKTTASSAPGPEMLKSSQRGQGQPSPSHEKRLLHKPIKKRRKSRIKGVAVMIARHQFTVVDEDDSLIRHLTAAQTGNSDDHHAQQ